MLQVTENNSVTEQSPPPERPPFDGERLAAHEVVRHAGDWLGADLALTASFGGPAGMVLLDMAVRFAPRTPVLLIDTGVLFDETYRTAEQVEKRYGIRVQRVVPRQTLAEQAATHGERLWERHPDTCCQLRKVEPLRDALTGYRGWMTAIRRDQTAARRETPVVAWSQKYGLWKFAPLAAWSDDDVWTYIHVNGVPFNPLLEQGYLSIGCKTCTRKPVNDDPRSGRWANFAKTECGLHI